MYADSLSEGTWVAKGPPPLPPKPRTQEFVGMLHGEQVVGQDPNVGYMSSWGKLMGRVLVTNYRLRFEGLENAGMGCMFEVPLGFIWKVEKVGHSTVSRGEDAYGILLHCKDLHTIRFAFTQQDHGRRALVELLSKYSFPLSNRSSVFAFEYAKSASTLQFPRDGWKVYDPVREYARIGVTEQGDGREQCAWVFTDINADYKFADTYPSKLVIPRAAAERGRDFLVRVGEFRSRHRIPALSWLHPHTQASITRCAQPLCGVTGKRSAEDEEMLKLVMHANPNAHILLLFDARPAVNAKVNKAKGGGFEEEYDHCQLLFLNIHNIHVVRESLRKLQAAIFISKVDEKNYLKMVDESKWLSHIQSICEGATQIVHEVEQNRASVLVHCSDGWDRTAQLSALAMLQLDPYYRTMEGFAVLIEKEWCSFGHKFAHRIGHGEDKPADGERSPIFLQFIDSVWQCMQQFPVCFEFNQQLLIFILDELYSCRFGTFLFNSEKQRIVENDCRRLTVSLWSYVLSNKSQFLNPLYNRPPKRRVIKMNTRLMCLKVWIDYYARHNANVICAQSAVVQRCANDQAVGRARLWTEMVHEVERQQRNREILNTNERAFVN